MRKTLVFTFLSACLTACVAEVPDSGPAPEFSLASLAGGTIDSEDLKGKVVVVDFWATWCQPCIREIPNYNALHAEHSDSDVVMLGITLESGAFANVEPFIPRLDIEYPVVMGDEDVVTGFGGYPGFPTTFVVSPDWQIYKKYIGNLPGKVELIEQDIRDLSSS